MAAQFHYTEVVDRPLSGVFHFFAVDHIRNHPRWDPDITLEPVSGGSMGVGTIIRRINNRYGTAVEGSMEVVEYIPNKVLAMKIFDGKTEMFGRTSFEALDDTHTLITTFIDIPSMEDTPENRNFLMSRLERSGQLRKQLIEAEISA